MEDILRGGTSSSECLQEVNEQEVDTSNFLQKDQYLGEFSETAELPDGTIFDEKAKVRDNLNLYSKPEIEDMIDAEHDDMLNSVSVSMQTHLNAEDPHGDRAYSDAKLAQQNNTFNTQLNTLRNNLESQISRVLINYIQTSDFETFRTSLTDQLRTALNNVYNKTQVYSKTQVDNLNQQFVKTNGSTPFTKPQEGIDPQLSRHLATKRYVDNAVQHAADFLNNTEFRTWINQKLSAYAKLSDTYSRNTIDNKLEDLVESVVDTVINNTISELLGEHLSANDPHGDRAYADGAFVRKDELETLTIEDFPLLVDEIAEQTQQSIEENIVEPVWKSTAPVQATVGLVENNTDFGGRSFTLQGIMDVIFYGKVVQILADESVIIGKTTNVQIFIHGPIETITNIVIKQGDEIIAQLENVDLDEFGGATVVSNPILEDTTFTLEVYYQDVDSPTTDSVLVKVGYGIFVGIIDKYQVTTAITWNDLVQLTRSDPDNNKMVSASGNTIQDIEMNFNFESQTPKQILIAAPTTYPSISEMSTSSQQFGIDAFNLVNQIPLQVDLDGQNTQQVLYKYMVYKQGLVKLSTKVTFKF